MSLRPPDLAFRDSLRQGPRPVGQGLEIEITNARLGASIRRVERCPVRIGRDPNVCTCVLDDPSISRLHASVDVREGRLVVRDVQSAIGTYAGGTRLDPNALIDLGPAEEPHEIQLGDWSLRLTGCQVEREPVLNGGAVRSAPGRAEPTVVPTEPASSPARGYEPPPPVRAPSPSSPPVPPPNASRPREAPHAPVVSQSPHSASPPMDLMAEAERLHEALQEHRARMSQFGAALATEMNARAPKKRAQLAQALWIRFPELGDDPELGPILQRSGFEAGAPVASSGDAARAAAFAAIQDLSRALGNEAPPYTAPEIEAFARAVKTGIGEILGGLMPLLKGVAQFEREMAVRTRQATSLQAAQNPDALGQILFDWQSPSEPGIRFLRSSFADLMAQQVGTLNGVMHGVRALLEELSPSAIASGWQAKQTSAGPLRKVVAFFTRPIELWRLYVERHSDLADEEQERFRIVFGPEFAEEYRGFKRALRQRAGSASPAQLGRPAGPSGTQVLPPERAAVVPERRIERAP